MALRQGIILLFSLTMMVHARGQQKLAIQSTVVRNGRSRDISLQANLPLGVFQRSHYMGAGISYAWTKRRFGSSVTTNSPLGIYLGGGADYYLGKNVVTAGYPFRYDNYFYFQGLAGLIYNPFKNVNAILSAGPSVGIYAKNSDFGFVVNLSASYYLKNNISIGPALFLKKHEKADALLAVGVRGSYAF